MPFLKKTLRFGVVGALTAVLHYGLLYIGVEALQLNVTVASSLGFVVAVIFNYLMHYSWTFDEPAPHGRTLRRYLVMIGCGFLINGAVMYAGVQWVVLNYLLTQALALVVVVSWNFVMSNVWVFRR
ncbi:MAG TPA: GtrA family protein [Halieaceae bacterium]|nr:MAG: GtrA family protein [Gammaproteobacteria bacterium]HDY83660.1 GtrA family protein [Halieaceae bacterium]